MSSLKETISWLAVGLSHRAVLRITFLCVVSISPKIVLTCMHAKYPHARYPPHIMQADHGQGHVLCAVLLGVFFK